MSIANRGSVYDKVLNEDWFKTPDMGEYWNNFTYKEKANSQSDKKGKTEFFVENPPTLEPGYHPDLEVIAIKANAKAIHDTDMVDTVDEDGEKRLSYSDNINDGDTIKFNIDHVYDTQTPFQMYYSETKFDGVKHYLKETLGLNNSNYMMSLRFIGIDTPEICHYARMISSLTNDDIYTTKYKNLLGTNTFVTIESKNKGKKSIDKSLCVYRPYSEKVDGVFSARNPEQLVYFLKEDNMKDSKYYEIDVELDSNGKLKETVDKRNRKYRRVVLSVRSDETLEYHTASEAAKRTVKEAFSKATDCMFLLDTATLEGKKKDLPESYKKSFEKSTNNPFYSLYDMWKSANDEKAAYKYSGYRVPGQESNGRFLAAIYLKVDGQWINLNKKVLYEHTPFAKKASYSDSAEAMVDDYYSAKGFKLWTYDMNNQMYMDGITQDVFISKDDREEIQKSVAGCSLGEMREYTVVIGDTLLMVPPTSIRTVTQTRTTKLHLLRAKGSVNKTIPKTERIIQMELYFNGEQAVNGVPIKRKLPNGQKVTYMMNGLRGLIAQFKLSPFLPIHNSFINDTLNIDAVSLSSYTITTSPNFPRTLQVTLSMQEFDWTQYMPCQAIPKLEAPDDLYRNSFSDTIHFPLFRFYYQRALQRGENLKTGEFKLIPPNHTDYIRETIGNKTALQPIEFSDSIIDFYTPDDSLLSARKQAVIEMKTRPLGRKFDFTEKEAEWIMKANALNKFVNKINYICNDNIVSMTDKRKDGYDPFIKRALKIPGSYYTYQDILSDKSAMLEYGESVYKIKIKSKDTINKHIIPAYTSILEEFNELKIQFGSIATSFDLRINTDSNPDEEIFEVIVIIKLNERFFDESESLEKIRVYCAKQLNLNAEKIFNNNEIEIKYASTFEDGSARAMKKPLALDKKSSDSLESLRYLAALTDSDQEGADDLDINDVMEKLKESIDIESAESIKFALYQIGNPVITAISTSYNNIFANMSLKAIDGHAAQYTGGSDAILEIEMIADDFTVGQLYQLNRECIRNIIEYRKILKSSPLRIDSDITRMLGIYEVIIDSLDINSIPKNPGKFKILMKLSSVDRTLRNKEALKKLQDIDNASIQKDSLINTKNFFDVKRVLGKAEIYPDLELPTVEELEKSGFYFLKHKYQSERVYPDPDFYFLYWYPTFANNLKTSITDFFTDPQNFEVDIADDFTNDTFKLDIKMKNNDGKSLFEVLDWDNRDLTYEQKIQDIANMSKVLLEEEELSESDTEKFAETVAAKMKKMDDLNLQLSSLRESIDNAVFNSTQINTYTNVTVKDIDIIDENSSTDKNKMKETSTKIKKIIKQYLKTPCQGYGEPDKLGYNYDTLLHFKPANYNDFKGKKKSGSEDGLGIVGGSDMKADGLPTPSVITSIAKAILNIDSDDKDFNFYEWSKYIATIIKACGIGAMATEGFFSSSKGHIQSGYGGAVLNGEIEPEPLCYPPKFSEITTEKGENKKVPICLYADPTTSELLIAHNEETTSKGVILGRYGIQKYKGEHLTAIFKSKIVCSDGFLDPYYNKDLYKIIYNEDMDKDEAKKRLSLYTDKCCRDVIYANSATFRQMLTWLYILIDNDAFLNIAMYEASNLVSVARGGKWTEEKTKEATNSVLGYGTRSTLPAIVETATNAYKDWKFKNHFNKLIGDEKASDTANENIENQEEVMKKKFKQIKKEAENYANTLICGMFYTLGAITIGGPQSSILQSVMSGDISGYANDIQNSLGLFAQDGISEDKKKISRYAQYLNYYFDEEDRMISNPIQNMSYNNKVQRAYLKAANDPSVYMLHSYYDMVMHDKRGSMARAFPTYYMLLIDEGRKIGLWKLQDNFYDMNSITEFEVVKSRKMAADTARIVMTNAYGTFNTDDVDQKDEYSYTMRDVFDSVFSPSNYFQKEYVRRRDARDVNTTKMEPGARVHLRMGYTSNAADLPIVFNGAVAEFEAGEMMTLICQGDGVELSNPHMFNPMDGKDVQDIDHKGDFFGLKQLKQTWDNLSTPRDMLVSPLAAEGSWMQEQIRKYSSGRFFNSNPFGIVHFGDRKYKAIFTVNGEVEQNIYESLSKPTWDYEESGIVMEGDGLEKEYELEEAPRVIVNLSSGTSYWDLMGIASSLSPDFITAVAPFQMRSTIFHGHPRFYYAYDYIMNDGKVMEKRKPYQQYHVYTSYSDIIDNKISTSQKDIRTNAVGHYVGPGWLGKKPNTVGPLFVDIDIFPEYQKSTSVNLNYEYKNNDILPFNIPIIDKGAETFDWGNGPNGEKTAWRSTASALKNSMKDMYKGELIVMGDPTVKPYDKFSIQDMYEDMTGVAEVEQVVHMFSIDTGFTTSITPDLISAIDNKYETTNNAITSQMMMGSLMATTLLIGTNLNFHKRNRAMYLGISKAAKHGDKILGSMINTALTTIGKSEIQRDAILISNHIKNPYLKNVLQISDEHIALADKFDDLIGSSKKIRGVPAITTNIHLGKALDDIDKFDEVFDVVTDTKIKELEAILKSDIAKGTNASELYKTQVLLDTLKDAKKATKCDAKDIIAFRTALDTIDTSEAKALSASLSKINELDLASDAGKDFSKAFRVATKGVEDFTTPAMASASKILATKTDDVAKALKPISKLDDVMKVALSGGALMVSGAGVLMAFVAQMAIELVVTKSAQNFLTNKLRNMQVLTLYPLKKDGIIYSAGIMGHQGSVVGSPSYDQAGWLETQAIKFFDYGSGIDDSNGSKFLALLRDVFITTEEMKEIVDGYKRANNYTVNGQSPDKIKTENSNTILTNIAKNEISAYANYKKIYGSKRITLKQISERENPARESYAFHKIDGIINIEQTNEIGDKLDYILSDNLDNRFKLSKLLYEKDCLLLAADFDKNGGPQKLGKINLLQKSILDENSTDKISTKVYVKELTTTTPKIYDVPYIRADAMKVFDQILHTICKNVQPDYENPLCDFSKIKAAPVIFHSGTRINDSRGWRSTGFLFTFEVKNYNSTSNIIKDIELLKTKLCAQLDTEEPFTIYKEQSSEFGTNAYSVFVHCPEI